MKLTKITYYILIIFIVSCSDSNELNDITRLGNFKNRPRGFQSVYMPRGQIALFIENTAGMELMICNVRYFIGDKGNCEMPFRVMIYSIDNVTGWPSDPLLPDAIIVSAKQGNKWFSIDISEYNVRLPDNGIFVAMEWIPDRDFNVVSQSECQYIAYNKTKNENNTWYCALGINWYQLPESENNAMISIDVK